MRMNRASHIVDQLLESGVKDTVMFWGGHDPIKMELESHGWATDGYAKDAMSKKVSTNDDQKVKLIVRPAKNDRWWQLLVWSVGVEFGDYLLTAINGIPPEHIVQAANDTEDLIGIWVNDEPAMDFTQQMILATTDVARAANRWYNASIKESGDAKDWLMHAEPHATVEGSMGLFQIDKGGWITQFEPYDDPTDPDAVEAIDHARTISRFDMRDVDLPAEGEMLDLADMAFWTIDGEYIPKGLF